MNHTNLPTADDVILDLVIEGVTPTHENLAAAVAAYPQHRDALVDFFAGLGVQLALESEPLSNGCARERFASIGLSHVLELHHRRMLGAAADGGTQVAPVSDRLSHLARTRGMGMSDLAARVGVDDSVVMKLDLRRITGPRPMEIFRRLGAELEIPPAHVIASTTGQAIPSSRGNLRKARGAIQVATESFEQAIRQSSLPEEAKTFWLGLLANKEEPKA